jgi:hypothetical protein
MSSVSEVVLFLGLCAEDFLSGSLLLLVALLDLVRSSGVLLATVLLAEHLDVVVHGDLLLAHVALDVICLCFRASTEEPLFPSELQQKNLSFPFLTVFLTSWSNEESFWLVVLLVAFLDF